MPEKVVGKFQKHAHFGFIIPDNRDEYGGDFFVTEKNMREANDGDVVVGHILAKSAGKKPEAKIVDIKTGKVNKPLKPVIGIYSEHKGDFGFVDVEGREKGYFVFSKDNMGANDGDKVEAKLKVYKGKKEAVITKIIEDDTPLISGTFNDQGNFGFVVPDKGEYKSDIFVAGAKKLDAKDKDKVAVKIIKESGRRPEGVIKKIL